MKNTHFCVYGAASDLIDPHYLAVGEQLGHALAEADCGLVFGGGASGMMGAVARGVRAKNGYIVGVAPSFFNVDGVLYPHCDELIYTETMRERKQIMEDRADSFIVTPGGIGTFEELFEILSLLQLGRIAKPLAFLNIRDYFQGIERLLDHAIAEGFMQASCKQLYRFFREDEIPEMLAYLRAGLESPHRIHRPFP